MAAWHLGMVCARLDGVDLCGLQVEYAMEAVRKVCCLFCVMLCFVQVWVWINDVEGLVRPLKVASGSCQLISVVLWVSW